MIAPNPVLDEVVQELRAAIHHDGWGRVAKIADVLKRHISPGRNLEGASRRPTVRQLARHPGCPLSKSQIQDVLAAAQVYDEEECVRHHVQISPSHAALVATLVPDERRTLLERVCLEGMSVRELAAEVRRVRRAHGERRGRPPTGPLEKATTRVENALLSLEEAAELLLSCQELDNDTDTARLLSALSRAEELCRCAARRCLVTPSVAASRASESAFPASEVRQSA